MEMPEGMFDWVKDNEALAHKLLEKEKQPNGRKNIGEIAFKTYYDNFKPGNPEYKKYDNLLNNIDPFGLFSLFNCEKLKRKRLEIRKGLYQSFGVECGEKYPDWMPIREDKLVFFQDYPSNQNRLLEYRTLWLLFESALGLSEAEGQANSGIRKTFIEEYEKAKKFEYTHDRNSKKFLIPTALFWASPNNYLPLDDRTLEYLCDAGNFGSAPTFEEKISRYRKNLSSKPGGEDYLALCKEIREELASGKYENCTTIPRFVYLVSQKKTFPNEIAAPAEETAEKNGLKEPGLPRNCIVFGAPGTGKSHKLEAEARKCFGGNVERITFHPDYTYSQFFGTYKPKSKSDGSITYEFTPGPFLRTYAEAKKNAKNPKERYLLIIEEINRANMAAVFGDVFQLLDRDGNGVSKYPISASEDAKGFLIKNGICDDKGKISIPSNMYIWATMNSADQGVFPMDTAFKRRWSFEYIDVDEGESEIEGYYVQCKGTKEEDTVSWNKLRKEINGILCGGNIKINEDKLMGTFFISKEELEAICEPGSKKLDEDGFNRLFKNKVLMYLFEDAAKQYRNELFKGISDNNKKSRFSKICEEFGKIGVGIFGIDLDKIKMEKA